MLTEFYPTPEKLLEKITQGLDWDSIRTILEPSAGKGDIAQFIKKKCNQDRYWKENVDIDCIEINPDLRSVLKGKDFRVVHDDFLTFHTFKHYDLIIMNPPFSHGAAHLAKALEMQKNGGGIICILNAETLKNQYTNERKLLAKRLKDIDAEISFMEGEFADAERPTGVEIAVIKAYIPEQKTESFIFETLKKKNYSETACPEMSELAPNDFVKAIVQQYNLEAESGLRLIQEYKAMCPYIMRDLQESKYNSPILEMKIGKKELSANLYIKMVREKYWNALFCNSRFTGNMTSNLSEKYLSKVEELSDYDFSLYNIHCIQQEMNQNLIKGIEECIVKLFDELSYQYAYSDELQNNIHYYNGWKTNKSWYINKKVILPGMNAFSLFSGNFEAYRVRNKLMDIEKVFNYLDGGMTESVDLDAALKQAKKTNQTRKIKLKYFFVSFYKKGTCHIEFTDENLLKKFNIFGSQQKGWLPQGYGKRSYRDMDKEEQAVVDSFEGEENYKSTIANSKYFIYDPKTSVIGIKEKAC